MGEGTKAAVVARKRGLAPLISVGVAYVGFLAGLLVLSIHNGPLYEPDNDLWTAAVSLGWVLLALLCVGVSVTSLVLTYARLRWWLRITTIALNVVVLIAASGVLPLSVWIYQEYAAGQAAYEAAVSLCGQPPVLATDGFAHSKSYILPNNPDYERMKYSTQLHFNFLSTNRYFCTEADAVSQGYQPG